MPELYKADGTLVRKPRKETVEYGAKWTDFSYLSTDVSPNAIRAALSVARMGQIGDLYALYDKMESRDDRYGGVVSGLKRAIASRKLKFVLNPAAKTVEERHTAYEYKEAIEERLRDMDVSAITKAFVSPYLRGATGYEILYDSWRNSEGENSLIVRDVQPIPVHRHAMDVSSSNPMRFGKLGVRLKDGRTVKLFEEFDPTRVFMLEDGKYRARYDQAGVARRCLTWFAVKTNIIPWWTEYAEVYGAPMRIAHTGSDDADVHAYLQAMLEGLGRNGWGIVPEDVAIELKEANRSGTVSTYSDLVKYADNAYTISVLGQNQTTDGGRNGSFAKAVVHNSVRYDILQDVAHLVERGWRHVAHGMLRHTLGPYNPKLLPTPVVVLADPTEMATKANAYNTLQRDLRVPIRASQIREEFSLSDVDDDEPFVVAGRLFENRTEYAAWVETEQTRVEAKSEEKTEANAEASEEK